MKFNKDRLRSRFSDAMKRTKVAIVDTMKWTKDFILCKGAATSKKNKIRSLIFGAISLAAVIIVKQSGVSELKDTIKIFDTTAGTAFGASSFQSLMMASDVSKKTWFMKIEAVICILKTLTITFASGDVVKTSLPSLTDYNDPAGITKSSSALLTCLLTILVYGYEAMHAARDSKIFEKCKLGSRLACLKKAASEAAS